MKPNKTIITMRSIFFLLLFLSTSFVFAQKNKITSDNYYDFLNKLEGNSITTDWLRRAEIVPIIIDEMEKYGFENNYEYKLYRLENNQFIVLEVFNNEFNFGFIYESIHSSQPNKAHRIEKFDYTQSYYDYLKKSSIYTKVKLPKNIYLLNEDCYWYQYENNKFETNGYVDRNAITDIFRSDIRKVLAKYKNLEIALEESKWKEVEPNPQFCGNLFVDNWAKFIEGIEGVDKYILKNTQYPEQAKNNKIEEEIILIYEVKTDGSIGEINVFQGETKY